MDFADKILADWQPDLGDQPLVLMDVSPGKVHAFWNIPAAEYRRAKRNLHRDDAPLILRVSDVTMGSREETSRGYFDLELSGPQGHQTVRLWGGGREYSVDVGFRKLDGSLFRIGTAPVITLSESRSTPVGSEEIGRSDLSAAGNRMAASVHAFVPPVDDDPAQSEMGKGAVAGLASGRSFFSVAQN
jgi:hypothetical protein